MEQLTTTNYLFIGFYVCVLFLLVSYLIAHLKQLKKERERKFIDTNNDKWNKLLDAEFNSN